MCLPLTAGQVLEVVSDFGYVVVRVGHAYSMVTKSDEGDVFVYLPDSEFPPLTRVRASK
jgi:hypothetical protein